MSEKTNKKNFWPWLKLALGAVVVTYVLKSRLIDFESLKEVAFAPQTAIMSLSFLLFTTVACCFRWYLLAKAQGLHASFRGMFELTMIGAFFNLFMPGSVGGDLIKGWYIAKEQPTARTRAVFTVLFDRGVGLSVFFFFAAITLLFYSELLVGRPALQALAAPIWGVSGALVVGGIFFFSPLWDTKPVQGLLNFFRKRATLGKLIDAADAYRGQIPTVIVAVVLSFVSVTVNVLFYYWLGQQLEIQATLSQFFFLVPVGVTASAVPVLPGGIGVAQVAFFKLFQWIGIPNPESGATLCTINQIYTVLFGCFGSIFYFKYRHKLPTSSQEAANDAVVESHSPLARTIR